MFEWAERQDELHAASRSEHRQAVARIEAEASFTQTCQKISALMTQASRQLEVMTGVPALMKVVIEPRFDAPEAPD